MFLRINSPGGNAKLIPVDRIEYIRQATAEDNADRDEGYECSSVIYADFSDGKQVFLAIESVNQLQSRLRGRTTTPKGDR